MQGIEAGSAPALDEGGSAAGAAEEESPPEAAVRRGYADASTWDERYEQESEEFFDWYAGYSELQGVLTEHCPPSLDTRVLMVGCGNSQLSSQMCEAGYKRIANIDISEPAIAKMRKAYADLGLEWDVMDARALTYEDGAFDLTVDKGTVDAMMHGGAEETDASALVCEAWRTLRVGGIFLLVSHSGNRHGLLGRACDGGWELLELRRTSLNPQAMLINILRSKLQGRPMRDAIKDPKMLTEAAHETKEALAQSRFLEAFRCFKARKDRARANEGGGPPRVTAEVLRKDSTAASEAGGCGDDGEADGESAGESAKPLRQSFCWVYVLRKIPKSGG